MTNSNVLTGIIDILNLDKNPDDSLTLDCNGYNINIKVVQDEGNYQNMLSKSLTNYLSQSKDQGVILDYNISSVGNSLNLEVKWKKRNP